MTTGTLLILAAFILLVLATCGVRTGQLTAAALACWLVAERLL